MVTPYTNEPENPGDRDNDQYRTPDTCLWCGEETCTCVWKDQATLHKERDQEQNKVAPALESWVPFEEFREKALENIPPARPTDGDNVIAWIRGEMTLLGHEKMRIVYDTDGEPLFFGADSDIAYHIRMEEV